MSNNNSTLKTNTTRLQELLNGVNNLSDKGDTYSTGALIPDDFIGTDTEKLQACFDALAETGGTITLNRAYTLEDNIKITHNSNLNHQITVVGTGKDSTINMGAYCFYAEHISGSGVAEGGVTFQNITFTGSGNLVDATSLIRLNFDNCAISGFVNVFETTATGAGDLEGGYMQTLYLTNCLIRSVSGYIFKTSKNTRAFLYDCKVMSCVIEWGGGIAWCGDMQGCSFSHNCIEGMNKDLFYVYCHINQATISENYFEANKGQLINLKNPVDGINEWAYHVLTISNNNFVPPSDRTTATISLPTTIPDRLSRIIIYGNKMPPYSTVPFVETDATALLTEVSYYGNYGTLIDPNGAIVDDFAAQIVKLQKKIATLEAGLAVPICKVTKNLTNCSINNGDNAILSGNPYSATLTANEGYLLDVKITPAKAVLLPGYKYSNSGKKFNANASISCLIVPIKDEQISNNRLTIDLTGMTRDINSMMYGTTNETFYAYDASLSEHDTGMFTLTPMPVNAETTTTKAVFLVITDETEYTSINNCDFVLIHLTYTQGVDATVTVAGEQIAIETVSAPTEVNTVACHEGIGGDGSIEVTMGGTPVPVDNNIVNIASVTGDIVITATADPIA